MLEFKDAMDLIFGEMTYEQRKNFIEDYLNVNEFYADYVGEVLDEMGIGVSTNEVKCVLIPVLIEIFSMNQRVFLVKFDNCVVKMGGDEFVGQCWVNFKIVFRIDSDDEEFIIDVVPEIVKMCVEQSNRLQSMTHNNDS